MPWILERKNEGQSNFVYLLRSENRGVWTILKDAKDSFNGKLWDLVIDISVEYFYKKVLLRDEPKDKVR